MRIALKTQAHHLQSQGRITTCKLYANSRNWWNWTVRDSQVVYTNFEDSERYFEENYFKFLVT